MFATTTRHKQEIFSHTCLCQELKRKLPATFTPSGLKKLRIGLFSIKPGTLTTANTTEALLTAYLSEGQSVALSHASFNASPGCDRAEDIPAAWTSESRGEEREEEDRDPGIPCWSQI